MEPFIAIKKNSRNRTITRHWPHCHSNKLIRVELVERETGEGYFANQLSDDVVSRQNLLAYDDLFKAKSQGKPARKIVVVGDAGIGKTTLCTSVTEDWENGKLLHQFEVLIFLPLCHQRVVSAGSLPELIRILQDVNSSVISSLKEIDREKVLVIADGWDELNESARQEGSFFHNLLFGGLLKLASILVTSRPSASALLHETCIHRFIQIRGFNKESIKGYIWSRFADNKEKAHCLIIEHLGSNPLVESLCRVPLICDILCHLWSTPEEAFPTTMTQLFTKVILRIIFYNRQKVDANARFLNLDLANFDSLPKDFQRSWEHLCKFAFESIQKSVSQLEVAKFFQSIKLALEGSNVAFHFFHPTILEYLAAMHLVNLPLPMQKTVLQSYSNLKQSTMLWKFFFGSCAKHNQCDVCRYAVQIMSRYNNISLCQCAFEARSDFVNNDVTKALSYEVRNILSDRRLTKIFINFGDPDNAQDFSVIMYVMDKIQASQCDGMEINFKDCCLGAKHISAFVDILVARKLKIKDLDLSDNNLSDKSVADLFHGASAAFKSLENLFLHGNRIDKEGITAIMVALAESSPSNLRQLDLSNNPLTLTSLEKLLRAVDSDILSNLEILILRGSLMINETAIKNIELMVKFGNALSSHCQHLHCLDIRSNNFGKPGTSCVRNMISQLAGIRRDFDLCLDSQYRSEVDNCFISVMEEAIRKRGTINHTVIHGVFVGPGRSGKNSVMDRLTHKGSCASESLSTGVLETVVKVEVKKWCTVGTAIEWKRLDYDKEAIELMMTTARCHSVSKPYSAKSDADNQMNSEPRLEENDSKKQNIPVLATNVIKVPKYISMGSSKYREGEQMKTTVGSLPQVSRLQDVSTFDKPLDIFKNAIELRHMDGLREHLESSWSLYLTNTGGQTDFQELLPILVCGPSVFFITFPLNQSLNEHYTMQYQQSECVNIDESPSTLIDEILQILATIAALDCIGPQVEEDINLKPKIFFIGTHKDLLPESSAEQMIQNIDEQLQEKITSTSLFEDSIEFAVPPKRLLFTVNNLAEEDDDFQKIRRAVQECIERTKEFTIKCPATWLIFSLVLRAKHKSRQVLSYNDCFTIAQGCGIPDQKELDEALSFIHTRLGLVRYFNVKELNTLVVIDPQILFDKITALIDETYVNKHANPNEINEFKRKGIIRVEVINRICKRGNSKSQLPFAWLLQLLKHLRIAAFFEGESKCFFPSILGRAPRECPSSLVSPDLLSPPPLLVAFKGGFCLRGIPTAVITYLMTNGMDLLPTRVFKNQVSFNVGPGYIILKIHPTHLSIQVDPKSVVSDTKRVKLTCQKAYKGIEEAMKTVTKGYRKCEHFFTFYCAKCKSHHPAEIDWCYGMLRCKITDDPSPLPSGYQMWNIHDMHQPGMTMCFF